MGNKRNWDTCDRGACRSCWTPSSAQSSLYIFVKGRIFRKYRFKIRRMLTCIQAVWAGFGWWLAELSPFTCHKNVKRSGLLGRRRRILEIGRNMLHFRPSKITKLLQNVDCKNISFSENYIDAKYSELVWKAKSGRPNN